MSYQQNSVVDQLTDIRKGALLWVHTIFWLCFFIKTEKNPKQTRPDGAQLI